MADHDPRGVDPPPSSRSELREGDGPAGSEQVITAPLWRCARAEARKTRSSRASCTRRSRSRRHTGPDPETAIPATRSPTIHSASPSALRRSMHWTPPALSVQGAPRTTPAPPPGSAREPRRRPRLRRALTAPPAPAARCSVGPPPEAAELTALPAAAGAVAEAAPLREDHAQGVPGNGSQPVTRRPRRPTYPRLSRTVAEGLRCVEQPGVAERRVSPGRAARCCAVPTVAQSRLCSLTGTAFAGRYIGVRTVNAVRRLTGVSPPTEPRAGRDRVLRGFTLRSAAR